MKKFYPSKAFALFTVTLLAAWFLPAPECAAQGFGTNGLVAFWPLQTTNGATTPDIVSGYDFTLSGTGGNLPLLVSGGSPTSHQNGELGNCLKFSAANLQTCFYYAGINDALPITKNAAYTIAFWVNANITNNANNVYAFAEDLNPNDPLFPTNNNELWIFGMDSGGGTNSTDTFGRFLLRDTNAPGGGTQTPPITFSQPNNATSSNVFDGNWHFVAITYASDGTNGIYSVYVDGAYDPGSGGLSNDFGPTALQSPPLTNTFNGSPWQWDFDTTSIGGLSRTTPGSNTINGLMDNVSMWNRQLGSDEIGAIYFNGIQQVETTTITVQPGYNLIADPLNDGLGNNINDALQAFSFIPGAQVIKWDNSAFQFGNVQPDGGPDGGWYTDDTLANFSTNTMFPGEGVFLFNPLPVATNIVFTGIRNQGFSVPGLFCGGGFVCLSRPTFGLGTFDNITGSSPENGAQVLIYRDGSGRPTDFSTNYFDIYTWCGGDFVPHLPYINIGQAAFFRTPCLDDCPTIHGSDNVIVTGNTATRVDFISQISANGCAGTLPLIVTRPPSGSMFAPGTTPVSCVAVDDSGLVANFSFNVTVAPAPIQPPLTDYGINITTGSNLIAYQLINGGNTLFEIFTNVPDGAVVSKYNNSSSNWLQSTYNASLGAWVPPNITLKPGEGAFLVSPTNFTLSFAGNHNTPVLPIALTNQIMLLSRQTNAIGNFLNITGQSPAVGTRIFQWNGTGYSVFTFGTGGVWSPFEPFNSIGQAWWISPPGGAPPPPVPLAPSISSQPVNASVSQGTTANFLVGVTGAPPFAVQWRLNGNPIIGATNFNLTINNTQPTNCGNYDVLIENSIGTVQSVVVTLSLNNATTLPFSDTFASAGFLPGSINGFGSGSNFNASLEAGEPTPFSIPGGASVWALWTAPETGVATFTTSGSGFDTLLGIYTGADVLDLTPIAADDDSAGFLCSSASFNATGGTTYAIQVDGFYGSTGNIMLNWNEIGTSSQLPVITSEPASLTVALGASASFNVSVQSGQLVTYQWLVNGVPIPSQSSPTLLISNVTASLVGVYQAEIVNQIGGLSVLTFPASLQINSSDNSDGTIPDSRAETKFLAASDPVSRPGDPYDPTIVTGYSGNQIYTMYQSESEPADPVNCGIICFSTVWHTFTATNSGLFSAANTNTSFDGVLAIYTNQNLTFVPLACSAGQGKGKEVCTFEATLGATYHVAMSTTNINDLAGTVSMVYALLSPPLFTTLPTSQTDPLNANVLLSVAATGSGTIGYQWQLNGTNIQGATNLFLQLAPPNDLFEATNQGNYMVIATNSVGTNFFSFAPVYLNTVPFFTNTVLLNNTTFFTQLMGIANSNYMIESSTDLSNWRTNLTTSSGSGVINVSIPYSNNVHTLFLRAAQQGTVN